MGDLILRSSDGFNFKVSTLIVHSASDVLKEQLNGAENVCVDFAGDVPVHQMSESSEALHNILAPFYLFVRPSISSYETILAVANASDKYKMKLDNFKSPIQTFLQKKIFMTEAPKHYALAWRFGLKSEAERASKNLLSVDYQDKENRQLINKWSGDPEAWIALFDLRFRREQGLQGFIEHLPLDLHRCPCHRLTPTEYGPLRCHILTMLSQPTPNAVTLLWSLESIKPFQAASTASKTSAGVETLPPLPLFSRVEPVAAKTTKGSRAEKTLSARHPTVCTSNDGCSIELKKVHPSEVYALVQRVDFAIQNFPQVINW